MLASIRGAVAARRLPLAALSQVQLAGAQRRWFSGEGEEKKEIKEFTAEQTVEFNKGTQIPFDAEYYVSPPNPSPALPEGGEVQTDYAACVNGHPKRIAQKLVIRIHQQPQNNPENTEKLCDYWCLGTDNEEIWTNQLMNYASTADTLAETGISRVTFQNVQDAIDFCERQGWKYYVDQPVGRDRKLEGKVDYAINFFGYHCRTRRAKMSPKRLSKVQFDHPERGKTCWVNLKHSDWGAKESKVVSQTHWSDPHPNNHEAKDWYMATIEKQEELARKISK